MSDFNPLVSIVIPVYNGSNYLREAIDSALAQTYRNIEILVINDGSTDGGKTEEIAQSYGDKIRYFHKENGGVATALNLGIREMRGEYFSWLSHDDVYYPHKIERQIECLNTTKIPLVVYSNFEYVDKNTDFISQYWVEKFDPKYFLSYLALLGPVHGCTLLIPKKCFDDVGLFNDRLISTQDYDMWFRIGLKYRFVHFDDVLVKSRKHEEQGSLVYNFHQEERDQLHVWFLDNLVRYKVPTPEWLPVYMLKISHTFRVRGYQQAFQYSVKLCMGMLVDEYLNLSCLNILLKVLFAKIKNKIIPW